MTSGCLFDLKEYYFKVGDVYKVDIDNFNKDFGVGKFKIEKYDDEIVITNIFITDKIIWIRFPKNDLLWSVTFENFRKYFISVESSNNLNPVKYIPLNQNN